MENRYTSVEDLITDASFRQWVNQTDAAAVEYWEHRLQQQAYLRPLAAEAAVLVRQLQFKQEIFSHQELAVLEQQIDMALDTTPKTGPKRIVQIAWACAAAAAVVLLITGTWLFSYEGKRQTIITAFGETKELILPDGSSVKLNAHSSLQYAVRWKKDVPREVWISGEAFLSVAPATGTAGLPFTVHTGHLDITVLGTSFNVYSRRDKAAVVLESGKIMAKAAGRQDLVLKPGQMASLSPAGALQLQEVNINDYTAWKNNRLAFSNATLAEIGEVLEDRYGYSIAWKNEQHKQLRFTGACAADNPALLLTAIAEAYTIRVIRSSNNIIIE